MEQFSGNYTGPYWSDGKFQESVAFGESEPQSELDALARLHDTAYATYKDRAHREAADEIFQRDARKLVGKFPHLAGDLALYGNYAGRQATQLASDIALVPGMPLFGLGKFAVQNMSKAAKMISGTYLKKEKADIEKLYGQDPRKLARNGEGGSLSASGVSSGKTAVVQDKNRVNGQDQSKGKTGATSVTPSRPRGGMGTKVHPTPPNPGPPVTALWPSMQARRFHNYNQTRIDALESIGKPHKKIKKRWKKGVIPEPIRQMHIAEERRRKKNEK